MLDDYLNLCVSILEVNNAKLVLEKANFDTDINVSVFETNIRIVGGLISAHLMARRFGESF